MRSFGAIIVVTTILGLNTIAALATEPLIDGIFGLTPIPEHAALAIWVPLELGSSVSGIRWFNNDGTIAFPEVSAIAGEPDNPDSLIYATVVAENVVGNNLFWSELSFETPIGSSSSGLYLIFKLPEGGEFVDDGQGAGIGYFENSGDNVCWIASGLDEWHKLTPDYQMAMEPIMNSNKSSNVKILSPHGEGYESNPDEVTELADLSWKLIASPNPFNPCTDIEYTIPEDSVMNLTVYDVRGYKVRSLVSGSVSAGKYKVNWNGRDDHGRSLASGIYITQLVAGNVKMTKRLTLLQ